MIFTTHQLGDGTRVRLRLARPSDMRLVQPFLGGEADLVARRLTYFDPHERLTLLAVTFEDGAERIAGLADIPVRGDVDEIEVTARADLLPQGLDALLTEAAAYTRLSLAPRRRRAA